MIKFSWVVALLALATAQSGTERSSEPFDFATMAAGINMLNTTWTAESPKRFEGYSLDNLRRLAGTWVPGHPKYKASRRPPKVPDDLIDTARPLPDSWDWRIEKPHCKSIRQVRDQGDCGCCWAIAAADTFSDRRCIKHGDQKIYSALDILSCCKGEDCGDSTGCDGGSMEDALSWIAKHGVVTGDLYASIGSGSSCKPFSVPPDDVQYTTSSKFPRYSVGDVPTPKCKLNCTEPDYPIPYKKDKTRGHFAYHVHDSGPKKNKQKKIMADLMQHGPQTVSFDVYDSLYAYKKGVYKHKHKKGEKPEGGHAVQLVGWGTEKGTPYWWVKNSWNSTWGLDGYFKMLRGSNECGIEEEVYGIKV